MWTLLLGSKPLLVVAGTFLAILLVIGVEVMVYRWGGSEERAIQAEEKLKQDIKERLADAKRYAEAPINASDAVTDKWLLQHVGR